MRLFVGNVPFTLTEDQLREHFAAFNCTKTHLPLNKETNQPRGFAFVEVENGADAVRQCDGSTLGGRTIRVSEAVAKQRDDRGAAPVREEYRSGDRQSDGGGRRDRSLWNESERDDRKGRRKHRDSYED